MGGHEGDWVWQHSGAKATIETWDSGCPDPHPTNSKDCGALVSISVSHTMGYASKFRDLGCGSKIPELKMAPICQRGGLVPTTITPYPTTHPIDTTTKPPQTTTLPNCPFGWVTYNTGNGAKKCFHLSTQYASATAAEQDCQIHGGHLASIHSLDEHNFLYDNFYQLAATKSVWVGGIDSSHNGVWGWTDGSPLNMTKWETGYPTSNSKYCMF